MNLATLLLFACATSLFGAKAYASGAPLGSREEAIEKADSWDPPRFFSRTGDYDKLSSDRERHEKFVRGFLENYEPWTRIVATHVGVPSKILLSVIANEQVFYSHAEHFAERFAVGQSVGLAQIQPKTLHAHGFYTDTHELALNRALTVNSFNIQAAGRLLKDHLDSFCNSLQLREAGNASGAAATDSFVQDILENESACSAHNVCSMLDKTTAEMDSLLEATPELGHCVMKASVAFWISGSGIIARREIAERRPNTMKRSKDGARLFKDFQ